MWTTTTIQELAAAHSEDREVGGSVPVGTQTLMDKMIRMPASQGFACIMEAIEDVQAIHGNHLN